MGCQSSTARRVYVLDEHGRPARKGTVFGQTQVGGLLLSACQWLRWRPGVTTDHSAIFRPRGTTHRDAYRVSLTPLRTLHNAHLISLAKAGDGKRVPAARLGP